MELTTREHHVLNALRRAGAVLRDDGHWYKAYRDLGLPPGYGATLHALERKGLVSGVYPGIQQTSGEKVWTIS